VTTPSTPQQEQIITAALTCFRKYGLRKTTMADIADEASIRRPHLYRYFDSKEALIVSALVDATRKLNEQRLATIALTGSIAPILTEALMVIQERLFSDDLLGGVLSDDGANDVTLLLQRDPGFIEVQGHWWGRVLEYGRSRHEIRDDLSNVEIVQWFLFSQVAIRERSAVFGDLDSVRAHLSRFVIPAVLQSTARVDPVKRARR
jgi:AcrR family transcriptional regulator